MHLLNGRRGCKLAQRITVPDPILGQGIGGQGGMINERAVRIIGQALPISLIAAPVYISKQASTNGKIEATPHRQKMEVQTERWGGRHGR